MSVTRPCLYSTCLLLPRKAGNLSCLASSGWGAGQCCTNRKQIRWWLKTSSDLACTTDHSSLKYNLMFALALTWSCVHFQENTATPHLSTHTPHLPPSSVSEELEQKGAPPIERFHHPGTEPVTSSSVIKTCPLPTQPGGSTLAQSPPKSFDAGGRVDH